MLSGVRVVEFSHPHTVVAGQILADLGAEVLTIEPVDGSAVRRLEPFEDGVLSPDASLVWQAFNRGKRAITLDVGDPDGQSIAAGLLAKADIVLQPSGLSIDGVDTGDAVHCVVRPFSESGPKSGYAYTDMVIHVSTGSPIATGDPDRAPLMIPVAQPMMEAGGEIAIAAIAALLAREDTGEGQQVGVSARIAAMMSALSMPYNAQSPDPPRKRASSTVVAGVAVPQVYECRDGHALVSVPFGGFVGMTERLAAFVAVKGFGPASLADVDWAAFPAAYAKGETDNRPFADLIDGVRAFCAGSTKREIIDAAEQNRFFAAPILDMADVAQFEQFIERGLWTALDHPRRGQIQLPTQFAQFSNYRIAGGRPAPSLSEHTWEVLTECGLSGPEIHALYAHSII